MSNDLFNSNFGNSSNDYIQPNLAPCPDAGDSYAFEFLGKKAVGVVNGAQTLASMLFSDFSQPITSWTQEKKVIESGEVIFIPGLTKGITQKSETFYSAVTINASVAGYYMTADISIGVYKNFRYTLYDVSVNADYSLGTNITSAINIGLAAKGIGVTVGYDDVSTFVFTASTLGYDFGDTALTLFVDSSNGTNTKYNLTKNTIATIPAFKYPNGAMLGYIIRTMFPTSATTDSDKWLYINHVPDMLDLSTGSTLSTSANVKSVDVGMNGLSTSTTISAGDYLNYVDTNGKWEKLGSFRAWISAEDPTSSSIENLITGFYLFNPQTFPIQIDYILVN
jgi:hypothetical protein